MAKRSFFDNPAVPRLYNLLQEVREGRLLVPKFQRPFVWDDERRLKLLDSVSKGIPIGSLLVWDPKQEDASGAGSSRTRLKCYDMLGPFRLEPPTEGGPTRYLIDGHQRLSTLYAALNTEQVDDIADSDVSWPLYYDLEENQFTARQASDDDFRFLRLSDLFAPRRLYEHQKKLYDQSRDEWAEKAETLANDFKDYQVPVMPLVTEDIDVVTDAFVRINSQGKDMKESYMVQALAYSTFPMRDRSEQLQGSLSALGWGEIDDQVFVNAIKIRFGLNIYRAGPHDIIERFKRLGLGQPRQAMEAVFEDLERDFHAALGLLGDWGVRGPAVLPYTYQLVALAEASRRSDGELPPDRHDDLLAWFWVTTWTGYFTGMTANRIREAVEQVCRVAKGEPFEAPSDLNKRVERPKRHNFSSVRSKAWALEQARRIIDRERRERALEHLGAVGASAVQKVVPGLASSEREARVVFAPRDLRKLRQVLKQREADGAPLIEDSAEDRLLSDANISRASLIAWEAGDRDGFLEQRKQELLDQEKAVLTKLGLKPSWVGNAGR